MKLVKLIPNLGYGSRKQVQWMFREGRITDADGEVLYADDQVDRDAIRVDGEPLDPPAGLAIALHKPAGYTCSTKDTGRLIYDLLPPRFRDRDPVLSTVGRLDRETSGLLLLTDDGGLLHRIISPKARLPMVYEVELGARRARLVLHEGRYHQVRRMFAAVGNHVQGLHRSRVGGLGLEGLDEGQWRILTEADLDTLFTP